MQTPGAAFPEVDFDRYHAEVVPGKLEAAPSTTQLGAWSPPIASTTIFTCARAGSRQSSRCRTSRPW